MEKDPEDRPEERKVCQVAEEVCVQDNAGMDRNREHRRMAAGQTFHKMDPGTLRHAVAEHREEDVWEVVELRV